MNRRQSILTDGCVFASGFPGDDLTLDEVGQFTKNDTIVLLDFY